MAHSRLVYPGDDLGLFTDLYELTMAQAYFNEGMFAPATFSLTIRNYPPHRGYLVSAGLEDVLDYLSNLSFSKNSLGYIHSQGVFSEDFLDYLGNVRFTGSVRAVREGRLFFADEPVLEVTAPIIEAQLAETFIINQMNLQTLLATKAARCVWAARGRSLSDFGSRRTQGVDAAIKMARCGYIVGFESTSNVLAAQTYGMPPAGTMAHSLISSFPSEIDAFHSYARTFPTRTVLLLDTYDTIAGAHNAVEAAKRMEADGHCMLAVRLDSGDFNSLSREVRKILNEAGLEYIKIVASGGLDEHQVERLTRDGAPIDIFGVGTKVGVSADAPWSDMAYKLVCYDQRPVMKLSPEKSYLPGAKQVFRFKGAGGQLSQDVIGLQDEELPDGEPVLTQVMERGRRTGPSPSLQDIREHFSQEFLNLPDCLKVLENPPHYPVSVSPRLQELTSQVRQEALEP